MPVNPLATEVGLTVGPVILDTLIKHYFDRNKTTSDGKPVTPLRKDELMYDEVFNVVKTFLRAASLHTVEDVQGFSNTRSLSPPWVHVVRLVVPMSCCDDAARYLVIALGGENAARRVVGGVKWWQARGIAGVDAQWITAKKDWREARRRHKMQSWSKEAESIPSHDLPKKETETEEYQKDMDEMRCILYSHGGGYYFGSVDQERYSIQRFARKINGRVFAVNYRLAPQYPFPCAIQDLLAAYLFLIRPPPDAAHSPVNPAYIVIAGDSAGGGLSLALLQVIRDSRLPMPAGGVLISPWCDLTHSFPSVHTNTATDVIPEWGLSMQKPSVLWPPPSDELSSHVHASLRLRIRQVFQADEPYDPTASMLSLAQASSATGEPVDVGTTASLPVSDPQSFRQTVSLVARSGETLTTDKQLHLYTQNSLLPHPLISPVMSYLGGLPPLFIIASDKEVLRDEIIYTAHKAANPDKYLIHEEIRELYPSLVNIESRFKPTKVHLQVYDDAAHVLPVLFSFTTPAKYCFRAIAAFCKRVTAVPVAPILTSLPNVSNPELGTCTTFGSRRSKTLAGSSVGRPDSTGSESPPKTQLLRRSLSSGLSRVRSAVRPGPYRSQSEVVVRRTTFLKGQSSPLSKERSGSSTDISRLHSPTGSVAIQENNIPMTFFAGDPRIYEESIEFPWDQTMLRERVSTQGIIRPLEPENQLGALILEPDTIGRLSELTLRRYLDASAMFEKKFAHTIRVIEKDRRRNLKLAKKDTIRNMASLHNTLMREGDSSSSGQGSLQGPKEDLLASPVNWTWAWALDGEEHPPPSSIVSRRDTAEARHLARVADFTQDNATLSGNRLWSTIVNLLTVISGQDKSENHPPGRKHSSLLSRFLHNDNQLDIRDISI